jgi:hypothetical protein
MSIAEDGPLGCGKNQFLVFVVSCGEFPVIMRFAAFIAGNPRELERRRTENQMQKSWINRG